MDHIYNPLEQYFIDQSLQTTLYSDMIGTLSVNPSISIDVLIELCTNCNLNYKDYIGNNPNLTIDNIETHLLLITDDILYIIGRYYDVFNDNRITFLNGDFIYKNRELYGVFLNRHLTYENFKSYESINDISNNDYISGNPNGNILNYDSTKFNPNDFNHYKGIYDNNFEEFIIKHKTLFKNNINLLQNYLSYDFIQNNLDIFCIKSHALYYNKSHALYYNKSLTILNVLDIIRRNINSDNVQFIFMYADITLDEIISNNLHNHKYFYLYSRNRNCTINDILTHPKLNWNLKELNSNLTYNRHDYDNDYIFKFAE